MLRLERLLPQKNGSEVKLIGQALSGSGISLSVDVFALHRESADKSWRRLSDQPHPDWRSMSVEEYVERGRSELHQLVGHGPILAMAHEVRRQQSMLFETEHEDNVVIGERPRQ